MRKGAPFLYLAGGAVILRYASGDPSKQTNLK